MLLREIASRTYFVRFKETQQYATAFVVDRPGTGQLLVSALHLLPDRAQRSDIEIKIDGRWEGCTAEVAARHGDAVALKLPCALPTFGDCPAIEPGGVYVGQDLFVAGFPLKLSVDYGAFYGSSAGVFLKKGALSAYNVGPDKAIYIDALNVVGFSGAPIYYRNQDADKGKWCLMGVVSGWHEGEPEQVYEQAKDGTRGERAPYVVPTNPGFMVAYPLDRLIDVLDRSSR